MYIADFELSKELWELSRWGQTDKAWATPAPSMSKALPIVVENRVHLGLADDAAQVICPAYDLGYLLRMLPEFLYSTQQLTIRTNGGTWVFKYGRAKHMNSANTPEDAACLLAIALFKEEVLTRMDVLKRAKPAKKEPQPHD